jgi:hypothetical protein
MTQFMTQTKNKTLTLEEIGNDILTKNLHFQPNRIRYHAVDEGVVLKAGNVTLLVYDLQRDDKLVYKWGNDAESSKSRGIIERNLEGEVKNIQRSSQHFHERGMHNTKQGSYGWISLIEN